MALGASSLALRVHRAVVSLAIDTDVLGGGRIFYEIVWHAERVVEPERRLAGQHAGGCRECLRQLRLEPRQAVDENGLEPVFLGDDGLFDHRLVLRQLRVGTAHVPDEHRDELVQERSGDTQSLAVTHRPPHDLSENVAPPLVGRHHAVSDEERRRSTMVGDDAHGGVRLLARAVCHPGNLGDAMQERGEEVRVVVGLSALQDRGDPFKTHAGVNRGRRQRLQRAVVAPLELHEHVVPDFNLGIERALADEVDFRAPAARSRVAHLPEVVVGAQLEDPLRRHVTAPDVVGLAVARNARAAPEDGHHQAVGRQLPHVGQDFPGELNRLLLEVVAEGKVAEHFEERVVVQRRSDVVQVVVLSADAHHTL